MAPRAPFNGHFLDQQSFVEHLESLPIPDDIVQALLEENVAEAATPATHAVPTAIPAHTATPAATAIATPATHAAPTATTTTVTTTMAGNHAGQNHMTLLMFQMAAQPFTNPTQQVEGPDLNQSETEEVMDHQSFMQTCKDFELMAMEIERLFEVTGDDLTNTLNDHERHSDDQLTILEMQDALSDFTDFHWEVMVIAGDMALAGTLLSLTAAAVDDDTKRSMLALLSERKRELCRIAQRLDSHEVKTGVFAEKIESLLTSVFEKLGNSTSDDLQEGNEAEQPAVASV